MVIDQERRTQMEYKIKLSAARNNAGLTQEDVARIMHVSKQTIVNWENGKVAMKPAQFKMFCEICQAPEDIIFLPKS